MLKQLDWLAGKAQVYLVPILIFTCAWNIAALLDEPTSWNWCLAGAGVFNGVMACLLFLLHDKRAEMIRKHERWKSEKAAEMGLTRAQLDWWVDRLRGIENPPPVVQVWKER